MKEAFNYMFKDNMIKQKALAYFGFILAAEFLLQWAGIYVPEMKGVMPPIQYYILFLLGNIVMFIPTGYGISCLKALMEQSENPVLPFVNVKNNFVLGFKCSVGVLLVWFAVILLYIVPLICMGLASVPGFNILAIISGIVLLLLLLLTIVFGIAFIIYYPALYTMFTKRGWLTAFFRFIKATKLIGQGAGTYFKGLGLIILIAIVSAIISGVSGGIFVAVLGKSFVASLLAALVTSLLSTYIVYVYAYITSKAVKHECI